MLSPLIDTQQECQRKARAA